MNSFNSGSGWLFDWHQNQLANRNDDKYHRNFSTGSPIRGAWQIIETYPRSPSGQRRDPQQKQQYHSSRYSTPDISVFRRTSDQGPSEFVPYEQWIPLTNEQPSSNAVGVTTKDDSIIELSVHCPVN